MIELIINLAYGCIHDCDVIDRVHVITGNGPEILPNRAEAPEYKSESSWNPSYAPISLGALKRSLCWHAYIVPEQTRRHFSALFNHNHRNLGAVSTRLNQLEGRNSGQGLRLQIRVVSQWSCLLFYLSFVFIICDKKPYLP